MGFGNYAAGAGTGALTGAKIGSMMSPGVGTAIGAAVGGLAGLFGGKAKDEAEQKAREARAMEIQNEPILAQGGVSGSVRTQAPTDTSWGDILQAAGSAAAQMQADDAAKEAQGMNDVVKDYLKSKTAGDPNAAMMADINSFEPKSMEPLSDSPWTTLNSKKPSLYSFNR